MAPAPIKDVTDFDDYRKKLRKAFVILDAAERCKVIEREAARKAKAEGLTVKPDPALVAENAGLVEWPVVLMGRIDPAYMDVPPEVLTTAMRHHLKHFALLDTDGNLAPRFLVVSNMKTKDGGKQIIAGNERVLRARLADAKFFWDQDRKRTLESRVGDLDGIVFHAKLGSLGDKAKRIEKLAAEIAVPGADESAVRDAGRLCKADLTTEMVGEFPELQGVMGRYYALDEGKPAEVADAIAEHYSPAGPNDDCPTAPVSVAVALADKIDTLVGFFAIDEKPTGSKDPYALRRAALGVIRLIVENNLQVSLFVTFDNANSLFPAEIRLGLEASDHDLGVVSHELLAFFADRLKVHLKEKGVRHDLINAVFAIPRHGGGIEDNLVRLLARVEALQMFLAGEDGEHLLTGYRRASNIVRIEEKKDGKEYRQIKNSLFEQDEEETLWQNLHVVQSSVKDNLTDNLFTEVMKDLAQLRRPIDNFFDEVMVNVKNDEDRRANRLALLRSIMVVMNQVADFSKIEGGER
ncbi:MAG: glycine--tRNA ligase subunit beta, partial [Proteobacteria bacterium]|nr:glycine--tRNA ligase subunit beta [Pseudomonadota bacterium]